MRWLEQLIGTGTTLERNHFTPDLKHTKKVGDIVKAEPVVWRVFSDFHSDNWLALDRAFIRDSDRVRVQAGTVGWPHAQRYTPLT